MELIHYTYKAKHRSWQLRPMHVVNRLHPKPWGSLWTSPRDSLWGWKEWCLANDYRQHRRPFRHPVFLTIKLDNVITINCQADLDLLPFYTPFPEVNFITNPDYEQLVRRGVDAIYLTTQGEQETRFSRFERDDHRNLYGWDHEAVLILNERCIIHYYG